MPNLSVVSNTLVCTASVSVGCFRTFERQFLLFGHAKIGGGQEMEGGGLPQFLPSTPIFARPNLQRKKASNVRKEPTETFVTYVRETPL